MFNEAHKKIREEALKKATYIKVEDWKRSSAKVTFNSPYISELNKESLEYVGRLVDSLGDIQIFLGTDNRNLSGDWERLTNWFI